MQLTDSQILDLLAQYAPEALMVLFAIVWVMINSKQNDVRDRDLEVKMLNSYAQQSAQDRADLRVMRATLDDNNKVIQTMQLALLESTLKYDALLKVNEVNARERDTLEAELRVISKERDVLKEEVVNLKQSVQLLTERLDAFERERDTFLAAIGRERERADRAEAERDALLKEVAKLQSEVKQLQVKVDELTRG